MLFPVLTLQLIVSIVFIQRHFDKVTRQMVRNVEPHVRLVLSRISASPDIESAIDNITPITVPFNMEVTLSPPSEPSGVDQRLFYDFSGQIITEMFRTTIPSVTAVNLLDNNGRSVEITAETTLGNAVIVVRRSALSASNPHQLLVLMVFAGILMTLIAFVFLRNQLKPIQRLANASDAFGRGQHLDLVVTGAAEVRSAASAFLTMRERIERQIEQRTLMLSHINHDLKTPLTRLRIGLELLEESKERNGLIEDVDTMSEMIEEFLAYSRDTIPEEFVEIDPIELAADVFQRAKNSGQRISFHPKQSEVGDSSVHLRPSSVRRSLENLVINAGKYASLCKFSVEHEDGLLRFVVEDDGPGIPAHLRETAMRPFTRLDLARNLDKSSGVGLGLAITRDVASSHGGSLLLGSSRDMGGLRAEMILPV